MSEVDLVVILGEGMSECQSVIASGPAIALSLKAVLVVADVGAHSVPAQLVGSIPR